GGEIILHPGGEMARAHQMGAIPQTAPGQGADPGVQGTMGIQDVYRLLPQQTPQAAPCPQRAHPAAGQGKAGNPPLPGPPIQLPPGVTGQEQAVPPPLHGLSLRQDAALLAAPPQGGFGVQDGISWRPRPKGHQQSSLLAFSRQLSAIGYWLLAFWFLLSAD